MPQEKLSQETKAFAKNSLQNRQLSERLKALLPERLRMLHRKHNRLTRKSSKSLRLALCDPEYIKFIEEYVDFSNQALENRINYETHLMLFQARQSIRAFQLARTQAKKPLH